MLYGARDASPEPIELTRQGGLPMSRTRLILLGLLAVVAAGAVIASTSGAEPPVGACTTVTSAPAYCVAGVPPASPEKFEGTNSGESILKATVSMVKTEIKCATGKSKGTIEDGAAGTVGKSAVTDTFETCKMIKPSNCKLSAGDEEAIKTSELKGELGMTSGRVEDKLESKTSAFAGIGIEGKESSCVISHVGEVKTFSVMGSQLCEVDSSNTAAEKEATTHKIICQPSGSSLEIGGPAEITSEATVKLTSGKDWSVKET
jgi:hypothetical protein